MEVEQSPHVSGYRFKTNSFNYLFFVHYVETRVRVNTQHITRQETRGAGERSTKQWGTTETIGDLWKGEGCDGVNKDTTRIFKEGKRNLRKWVWGGVTWTEKDQYLGWGKI